MEFLFAKLMNKITKIILEERDNWDDRLLNCCYLALSHPGARILILFYSWLSYVLKILQKSCS